MTILEYGEDAASDLRDLDGMGQARPVEVSLGDPHDLGLVLATMSLANTRSLR